MLRNSLTAYGGIAKLLHWGMAGLIFYLLFLGFTMHDLPGIERIKAVGLHKSLGITVLALATLRLGWRLSGRVPLLPEEMKPFEKLGAHLSHFGLYALLFAMPLSGWMMSSTAGFSISFFGLFQLPDLVGPSKEFHEFLEEAHALMAYALIGLFSAHAGAALYHHFHYRDDVLRRMLPFIRQNS